MNRVFEKWITFLRPSIKNFQPIHTSKILTFKRSFSSDTSTDLKSILAAQIPKKIDRIKNLRKQYGTTKISDITVDMMFNGMREINGLISHTTILDDDKGICFRGLSIPECQKNLPHTSDGFEPLPESLFWLLITGKIPSQAQVSYISQELNDRAAIPNHIITMLKNFPKTLHPMRQFAAAITALNHTSKVTKAYSEGIHKSKYWEPSLEDSMDLIAKLPTIAAIIYNNTYRDGINICAIDPKLDWSANFTRMLGFENEKFKEFMRLYLSINSDHEIGNVTNHVVRVVGSALSDPYLSFAAGINGMSGPLNEHASQDMLMWLKLLRKNLGNNPNEQEIKDYVWKNIKAGKHLPGYGEKYIHSTDPHYTCQREFIMKHSLNDPLLNMMEILHQVTPSIVSDLGNQKNTWPNADVHSSVLMNYFGIKEIEFHTLMFGVSRAIGTLSSLVWDRALVFPIEHPISMSTNCLSKAAGVKQ